MCVCCCRECLGGKISWYKWWPQDFPGSPVVKTPCFYCQGHGFDPWLEWRSHMRCSMAKKNKNQNTKTKWWPWGAGWELDFLYTEQLSVLLAYVHYVAQMVKNPPAMQETQVQSLGGEDPLEKEMATLSILAWRIPWAEEPDRLHGVTKSWT